MTEPNGNRPERRGKDYEGKSRRIHAWSDLLRSVSKVLWLIVVLIVVVALGKMFIFKSKPEPVGEMKPQTKPVITKVKWEEINQEIEGEMRAAREETEAAASKKLDAWIDGLMVRVDEDFLDWYFGYWTQQEIGLKGLLYQVLHWVDGDNPPAAERITHEVQEEFASRVLRPQIAQMEVERIVNEIVSEYSTRVQDRLEKIPEKYEIKPADWYRYLGDIAVMVKNVEASRRTPITLKAIAGVTAGGVVFLFRAIKPAITRISARLSARWSAKAATRMATKTGGAVAAKMGGRFVGAIIAVGIIIWDVWDHHQTKKKAMPVLRQNIYDYLQEVKNSILRDPEFGIITIIYNIETGISEQFEKTGQV